MFCFILLFILSSVSLLRFHCCFSWFYILCGLDFVIFLAYFSAISGVSFSLYPHRAFKETFQHNKHRKIRRQQKNCMQQSKKNAQNIEKQYIFSIIKVAKENEEKSVASRLRMGCVVVVSASGAKAVNAYNVSTCTTQLKLLVFITYICIDIATFALCHNILKTWLRYRFLVYFSQSVDSIRSFSRGDSLFSLNI